MVNTVSNGKASHSLAASATLGRPLERVDGALKVTGRAPYAYEQELGGDPAYGYILGAAIAKGRIAEIDTAEAERVPGVLRVMTYSNAPAQARFGPAVTPTVPEVFTRARPMLASERVRYRDEPVAFVVAETFEVAREAAGLIRVRYEEERGIFDFEEHLERAYAPIRTNAGFDTDSSLGDFEGGFASAPVKIDVTYRTSYQHHNPMEPHAALAVWDGDHVTIYTGAQILANFRAGIANTLNIPPEQVRIISPFIGGGFGAKLIVHADTVLAALAARELRRPVKVALTRQQMFANAGHRAAMIHQVRLGASREGYLTAIGHDVWSATCIKCCPTPATHRACLPLNAPWMSSQRGSTSIRSSCGSETSR
jgi:xanthine dehydrogenase YagR molybdenum-binding subunit